MNNILKTSKKLFNGNEIKLVMTVKTNTNIDRADKHLIVAPIGTELEIYMHDKNGVVLVYSGLSLLTLLMQEDFQKLVNDGCFEIVKIHLERERVDA